MTQPPNPPAVAGYLKAALGAGTDGPSDAELLGRFADGRDEAAFELLVWRHAGMVSRAARAVLRDHHAAEDVTQAAFLVLARKAGSIGRREAVAGWLYRVARRLAVRSARRFDRTPPAAVGLDRCPDPVVEPDEAGPHLLAELDRLPEAYRLPVLLCFFEGLTHADAAKRLGWPAGTVAGRLARAKALLRDRLTRRGVAVPAAGFLTAALAGGATAVSPSFVDATTRAAVALAAGESIAALVSSHTAGLVKGASVAMTGAKVLWAAGLVTAVGLIAGGGIFIAAQGPGGGLPGAGGPPPGPAAAAGGGGGPTAVAGGKAGVADGDQRRRSQANLKRLLVAMHNYEATYQRLPMDVAGADGKPLLSWRVELLPFLDQDALYRAFKRDEPWDGEHNLKLLARMPAVFRVGFEPKDSTHTYYQRFALGRPDLLPGSDGPAGGAGGLGVGPGGAGAAGEGAAPPGGAGRPGPAPEAVVLSRLDGRLPERIVEITDGTSNTLGVVEAGPPVAWTKPENFIFVTGRPLPKLIVPFANTFNVATYDGAAHSFKPSISPALLAGLIGPNDGLVLPNLTASKARFPVESAAERDELRRKLAECTALLAAAEGELKEHAKLVELRGKRITEIEQAEEQREGLLRLLEALKAKNKQIRDDLGSRKE